MPVKTQEQLRSELDATIFKNPGGGIVPATVHSLLLDMIDSAGTGGGPNYVSGTGAAVGSGSGSASALALFRAAGTAVGSGSAAGITGTAPAFIADFTALTSLPTGISLSRATTGTYFDASGVLQTAAIDAPRFDHAWNGSAWVATGLLIEEQRTNICQTSADLSTLSWSLVNATLASGITDLSGGTAGVTVTASAGAGVHCLRSDSVSSVASGSTVTATVYIKQGTAPYTVFGDSFGSNYLWGSIKWSDLSLQTSGTDSATITKRDCGNGVYAVSITWVRDATNVIRLQAGPNNNSAATIGNSDSSYTAAGTETAIVLACQIEQGTSATSFIPTTTAAATRSADIAQLTGAALEAMQAAAASVIIEADTTANAGTYQYLLGPGSGLGIGYNAGANFTYNGTVNLFATPDSTRGDIARLGLAFSGAGRSLSSNGNTTATDANLAFTSTPSALYFGNGSANLINGHYRSIAIYNTRLSDSDLQTKSVVGAPF